MTDRDPETPMIEPISRGVLDHPLEPVIGGHSADPVAGDDGIV
jgi:hypothetical protein